MKIKALKTLLFLAENDCNFSGHKILGIPRSTMWSHISELETETGLKLIERRKQNSSFTEEGRTFIPFAMKIDNQNVDLARVSYATRIEETLTIGH